MASEEIDQRKIDEEDEIKSTIRMSVTEREVVIGRFGGVQSAWNNLVKEAQEDSGWIPSLPKRLIPAYRAIRDVALTHERQTVDSLKLREVVMNACNCTKRTAGAHLHELKDHKLIHTLGVIGDEFVHFVACSAADVQMLEESKKRRNGNI